jgi:hypothetical protein
MVLCLLASIAVADDYDALKDAIAADRHALAEQAELIGELPEEAHRRLVDAVLDLVPSWEGTRWDMNGTTEVPGEGRIACGYFVSTVLRDAGLQVERVRLAQQASEHIVTTVADEGTVMRYWGATPADVVRDLGGDDGIFVVGLDRHVGLLVVAAGEATFCHASRSADRRVVCEDPHEARSLISRYTVVAPLGTRALKAWVDGTPMVTDSP